MARFLELQPDIQGRLAGELEANLQQWNLNLWQLTRRFEEWPYQSLTSALTSVSLSERQFFTSILENAQRAFSRIIESFQNRLAERVERVLGVRLSKPAYEIAVEPPQSPSVFIGNVSDHHFDLLWFVIPMTVFGGLIKQHLRGKLPGALEKEQFRVCNKMQ